MRLPANVSLFVVPAVCLILLGAAWAILRGGGESEERERPALKLLCEDSLKAPVTGIIAAYERRGGVTVEVEFVPSSGLANRLVSKSRNDLVLLNAGDPIAKELIDRGLVVAPESGVKETPSGSLRWFPLPGGESPDSAAGFTEFLGGSFATGILQRFESASEAPPR